MLSGCQAALRCQQNLQAHEIPQPSARRHMACGFTFDDDARKFKVAVSSSPSAALTAICSAGTHNKHGSHTTGPSCVGLSGHVAAGAGSLVWEFICSPRQSRGIEPFGRMANRAVALLCWGSRRPPFCGQKGRQTEGNILVKASKR